MPIWYIQLSTVTVERKGYRTNDTHTNWAASGTANAHHGISGTEGDAAVDQRNASFGHPLAT